MSEEELQELWDRELLDGWQREGSMAGVKAFFFKKATGLNDYEGELDWGKVDTFLESCALKRYELMYVSKQPVRAFVANRSPNLSGCLWSGKYSHDELLEAIDRFKWTPLTEEQKAKFSRQKYQRYRKGKNSLTIKARELTKKHDWNTVK